MWKKPVGLGAKRTRTWVIPSVLPAQHREYTEEIQVFLPQVFCRTGARRHAVVSLTPECRECDRAHSTTGAEVWAETSRAERQEFLNGAYDGVATSACPTIEHHSSRAFPSAPSRYSV